MKFAQFVLITCILLVSNFETIGQNKYPPQIEGTKEITFKTVDNIQLNLWIFNPPKHQVDEKTPAIVFFFGGGWKNGNPNQFEKHCQYLSARGMVAIVADYRVYNRHGVLANKCVSDAKSAIRWVREHSSELGIDPNRIAAGGGSAGGHLAAATATLPKFDEPTENAAVSSKPNALVLFNPALVLAPVKNQNLASDEKFIELKQRMGASLESMSPFHNIKPGMPPTIIFHGMADTTVPFITARLFTEKMNRLGNDCKLVGYKDEPHGFFNFGKNSNGAYIDSVYRMDEFLVSLGYLVPPPEAVETY